MEEGAPRPHVVRPEEPARIVLTGPESTGKTTLAGELARIYDTSWSPEFAREYADARTAPLLLDDVDPIGRGQRRNEDDAIARARNLVILDTDLVSTMIYSRFYYGTAPEWIEPAARERLGHLYLFPSLEAVFEPDHVRDTAEARTALENEFLATLERFGARIVHIRGSVEERLLQARRAIDDFMTAR
jgi:nicotinamide riboside kinase